MDPLLTGAKKPAPSSRDGGVVGVRGWVGAWGAQLCAIRTAMGSVVLWVRTTDRAVSRTTDRASLPGCRTSDRAVGQDHGQSPAASQSPAESQSTAELEIPE
ncbi:unnamed protein product, partial [Gadus morhua 'NCC']